MASGRRNSGRKLGKTQLRRHGDRLRPARAEGGLQCREADVVLRQSSHAPEAPQRAHPAQDSAGPHFNRGLRERRARLHAAPYHAQGRQSLPERIVRPGQGKGTLPARARIEVRVGVSRDGRSAAVAGSPEPVGPPRRGLTLRNPRCRIINWQLPPSASGGPGGPRNG